MTPEEPHVKLELRSNPLFLSGAREMVSSIAKRLGFSDEAAAHIALAIDEALCNVIRHGYDREAERPIWISLFPEGGVATPASQGQPSPTTGLRIVIEDEAKQVDPSVIKSRDLDEIRPGGLGVHIIQQVMDSVNYEHRTGPGGGMRLTMVKRKGSPADGGGMGETDGQSKGAHS
jgi:anti-sigma regulatory factor (Ser/Thr protein kinase)